METVAVDDEIQNGDVLLEDAATSSLHGQVDAKQGNDDHVQDDAGDPLIATSEADDRQDDDDGGEITVDSETTFRRHSQDGSTERPADCSHSSPPGILLA